jgi:sporulation protein YlmC with PRC-barrel domain
LSSLQITFTLIDNGENYEAKAREGRKMRASELIGKEVIDAEARRIGNVKDIDLDWKKWSITGIIVRTGYISKMNIPVSDIDKVGDKVILKVARNKIQKA